MGGKRHSISGRAGRDCFGLLLLLGRSIGWVIVIGGRDRESVKVTLSVGQSGSDRPVLELGWSAVFPHVAEDRPPYLRIDRWSHPVTYLVGRNGSGKSRTAKAIARALGGHYLSTDRLVGLMNFTSYSWGPVPADYKGVPLSEKDRRYALEMGRDSGTATREMYELRERPDVWLRVAAFIRRALGRSVQLRDAAGYLDPRVEVDGESYSLLRDEGHGLRELVVLLTATYRADWELLVVDEPELHLHPSMARLWLAELNQECVRTGHHAVVVTHEPSLIKPSTAADLGAVYLFSQGSAPRPISAGVPSDRASQVDASLALNPQLVSQLVFSPRPVLVEGPHDVAALSTALARIAPLEVLAQTDFVNCGGSGLVGLWFDICGRLGIDVRGVADLDAVFDPQVQNCMDSLPQVQLAYRWEAGLEPPRTHRMLRTLIEQANADGCAKDARSRALWLAAVAEGTGWRATRDRLLDIWRRAGLWLHPQGTLEQVLGLDQKGEDAARQAAQRPGAIDAVAQWCAFELDTSATLEELLNLETERIAQNILRKQREDPKTAITSPIGSTAEADRRLVTVSPAPDGAHRLEVLTPPEFAGYWMEFSRDTPPTQYLLQPPIDYGT